VSATSRRAPIAIALDAPSLELACDWAAATADSVAMVKVGLQAYLRDGAPGVRAIQAAVGDQPVGLFLDLKLHDIPNTVAGAAASVAPLRPALLTVHAAGGSAMIAAAAQALPDTLITAVTVLTSMSAADLESIGMPATPREAVVRLATLAVAAGARALVCSPQEVADVRAAVGPEVLLVTPGVRPAGGDLGDQQRVATPESALASGADLLVIGRPITGAADVGQAAREISGSLSGNR